MIRSLHAKLSLALLAVLVLAAAALLVLSARSSQLYQQEVQQKLNVDLAAHMVQEYPLIRASQVNSDALEDLFHELMVVNPSIEVYLLDPEGSILEYSAPPGRVRRTRVSLAPVEAFLRGASRYPLVGDDPRDPNGTKVFSAAPIRVENRLEGYLYVVLAGEAYAGIAGMLGRSYILRFTAWVVGAVLLLSLVVAAVLFRRLTGPLGALDQKMQDFARSEPGGVEQVGDEVARLEVSFERMSRRIRDQIGELERNDRLRRELVASVSHDLRTPLTHLQGYLDTLVLKSDSLSEEERSEYLHIAVRHSERLGRLVGDLFELAKLDALQAPVVTESISITELARDVVANAQLAAAEHGVTLLASAHGDACAVDADPGLIERTLENLVSNALRHAAAGGRVEVLVRRREGRVVVCVRDDGEGIPLDEQERIFDRFYRTSQSARAGHGSGLGLAIAKRAVELHAGHLSVHSAPGQGTVFDLELPAAS